MAILKVLTVPDPLLKRMAKPCVEVDDHIRKIMDDMIDTMNYEDGIGLASIQVGIEENNIVIDASSSDDIGAEIIYPLMMANAEIIEVSNELVVIDEACLSVPGVPIPVERPRRVKVKYLDYHNHEQVLDSSSLLARIIQHEMDHQKGITIVDYLSKLKRDLAIKKVKKTVKNL